MGDTNSRVDSLDRGRFGQTIAVGRNRWQERRHKVDKMDTEGNSKDGKLEIWKEEGLVLGETGGLTRVEKIMVLDWG